MKLPELKEKLKSKYIVRVVAGVLTIALAGTGIGATAVFAEKNSTAVTAEADSTTGISKDVYKRQTHRCPYVFLNGQK